MLDVRSEEMSPEKFGQFNLIKYSNYRDIAKRTNVQME